MLNAGQANTIGLNQETAQAVVICRGVAGVVGDIITLDPARTSPFTTTSFSGATSSCYANAVSPAGDEIKYGWMGVLVDPAPANGQARAVFSGIVPAKVNGTVAPGDYLVARTDRTLGQPTQNGQKIIARVLDAGSGVVRVDFDGIHGFGIYAV